MSETLTTSLTIRALARSDLDAVVAIDAAIEGRSRRAYVERRLAAALREPKLHAQFAACSEDGVDGFILARVLEGEFGRTEPGLRLELVAVRADARAMRPDDLREIVRIDRGITGRDRTAYISGRLDEAMDDSTIRVSLAAKIDGAIVGFLMARADLGDFGRLEPVAVIDTIGVDPGYGGRGIGHALVTQLFANLRALHIERAETVVGATDASLLGFFYSAGFTPSPRLSFVHRLGKPA